MKPALIVGTVLALLAGAATARETGDARAAVPYQHPGTRALAALVTDAARLVETRGEQAFPELRVRGSRWRRGETYVFVLDPKGDMLVHPDPKLEGRNQLALTDVNGKPIVKGLLAAASVPGKPDGWYHYEWPVPDGLVPRWKSSYVRRVDTPSGKSFIVGAGMYDDRMERAFALDLVRGAVAEIERHGRDAFPLLRDRKGPFVVKDTYVFVLDANGVELVNPGFPNLEGRPSLDMRDAQGKYLNREMLEVVRARGEGWVEYMWPKPGESVATRKSTFVGRARVGDGWVLVGCGVYPEGAPKALPTAGKPTAPELMNLVRDAAAILEKEGERAYPQLGRKGSRWFHDDTYLFVWTLDGVQAFNAGEPATNGQDRSSVKDIRDRPVGRMILDVAASDAGEGWIHYMYPKPGQDFPAWKSTFLKRVTFPSGRTHVVGSGIYEMQMDRAFVKDVVDRAAALVAARGAGAFPILRDPTGPFVFMDTYVFVDSPDGTEVVNPAQPSLEGRNLANERDAKGRRMVREYLDAALRSGDAWVTYDWYKPGGSTPQRKETYVRKVTSGSETYVVGAGLYPQAPEATPRGRRP